ncbi:hypothetical protein NIE88_14605 [Sporolactobacillus shoreicorticis]|uniref:Uncharacterized protein n=1 Tax=Sporolactobacillus shoreicorticis TaxID=1923877 RepID=A0ABW5S0J7_9BACL|nr:hypothetical protein [Sporolactobacillus shoreicorticis]MCO7126998.1 hypothetical protein [Sporolactobacillus shoreicorticis]
MQIPQIRTVITTSHSMKNTYNQLSALEQEKRAMQYHADQIYFHYNSESKDNLSQIEITITGLDHQIRQIRNQQAAPFSDQVTVSRAAYRLYTNSVN